MRMGAASALGSAFAHVIDKEQATKDLLALTKDEDSGVRRDAADALGSAFPHVTDKEQATKDLLLLTKDDHTEVRVFTNYSLGRISIFKATEAVSIENYKKELNHAVEFFEQSSIESTYFNPAQFCHPFYKSICSITFEEKDVEAEVQEYLNKAKSTIKGSESKKLLVEAVENLENALREVHNVKEMGLDVMKSDLKALKSYCDRASDILASTEEKAPGATKVLRRGLPIIDQRIQEILSEIQKNAEILCKHTINTQFEDLGKEVNRAGQNLSDIRDPIALEKHIINIEETLSVICDQVPKKGEACRLLEKTKNEPDIEDKLPLINMILSVISSQIYLNTEIPIKPTNKKLNIIQLINSPATIAAFAGFIILEVLSIYPTGYNKHITSIVLAGLIFILVFIIQPKKN